MRDWTMANETLNWRKLLTTNPGTKTEVETSGVVFSEKCPTCGSSEYETVKRIDGIVFANDRRCKQCSTIYSPPTPTWARPLFGASGVALIAFGCFALSDPNPTFLNYLGGPGVIVIGCGCLAKMILGDRWGGGGLPHRNTTMQK
jgi:hypothetical protein